MKSKAFFLMFLAFLLSGICFAQERPKIKIGKVEVADFDLSPYKIDPDAEAVVVVDMGNTEFTVNKKQQFALVFKRNNFFHETNTLHH